MNSPVELLTSVLEERFDRLEMITLQLMDRLKRLEQVCRRALGDSYWQDERRTNDQ